MRVARIAMAMAMAVAIAQGVGSMAYAATAWASSSPAPAKPRFDPLDHPVHHLAYWKRHSAGNPKILTSRVGDAPPELIDYLIKVNELDGFPSRPAAVTLDPSFKKDMLAALNGLPMALQRFAALRLAGIFVVKDLGTTAFSESILEKVMDPKRGEILVPRQAIIVMDRQALDRKANEWLTWRESTPFKANAAWKLEARIEERAGDNRVQALQFVLLHEIGHVIAEVGELNPSWVFAEEGFKAVAAYPYSSMSWTKSEKTYASRFDAKFALRPKLKYYGDEPRRLPADEMPRAYSQLKATDFATLYGATNFHDDFAEAFATYVHVVMMGKPYEVRVLKNGTVVEKLKACWSEPRCDKKRAFIDKLMESAGAR